MKETLLQMAFKTKLHGKVAYDFLTSNKHKALMSYLGWADKMRFVNQHEQLNSVFCDRRTDSGRSKARFKIDIKG